MKSTVIVFMFLVTSYPNLYSQTLDTIYLKEVQIKKKPKGKILNVKTRGESSFLTGEMIRSAVSRVDNIPSGKLASIKLFFNHSFLDLFKGKSDVEYTDLELGLLIFSANDDGTIGQPVTDKEIRFTVGANHRGSLELNLDSLFLNSEKSMYFGFEIFTKQIGKNIRIIVDTDVDNSKTFYVKSWNNNQWYLMDFGKKNLAMKMNIAVLISN